MNLSLGCLGDEDPPLHFTEGGAYPLSSDRLVVFFSVCLFVSQEKFERFDVVESKTSGISGRARRPISSSSSRGEISQWKCGGVGGWFG